MSSKTASERERERELKEKKINIKSGVKMPDLKQYFDINAKKKSYHRVFFFYVDLCN